MRAQGYAQDLSRVWRAHRIGRPEIETVDPITLTIYDAAIWGQLPRTYIMINCAFRADFLPPLLSARPRKEVPVRQGSSFAGGPGAAGSSSSPEARDAH